jgi:hypothetical protein
MPSHNLRPGRGPGTRPDLRALARVTDAPWELTLGADPAVPGVAGRRPPGLRLAGAYVTRLQAAAAHDPALAQAFVRVTGLVDPPEALLCPAIVLRGLRPGRRRRTPGVRTIGTEAGARLALRRA